MTKILNIAHRGARSLAPENTLAAARKAIECGADMWELDVTVSSDGVLYLHHDDTLTRATDAQTVFPDRAPWSGTTFTLAELKKLETGTTFINTDPFQQIAAGAVDEAAQAELHGEPIPTLREALVFTRDSSWRVNIEIKKIPAPLESFPITDEIVRLVEELDMVEQVLISSFVSSNLQRAKRLNPAIKTAALAHQPGDEELLTFLRELRVDAYHPFHANFGDEAIRLLRDNNFAVNVWTVNSRITMEHLCQVGVSGIITDFPQTLTQVLS